MRGLVFTAVLSTFFAGMASAATLFSQDFGSPLNGSSSRVRGQQVADDFVLGAQSTVRSVRWYGVSSWFSSDPSDRWQNGQEFRFNLRIYADVPLAPGQASSLTTSPNLTPFYETAVSATAVYTGELQFVSANPIGLNIELFEFSTDIGTPVNLDAGVTYWLSILENPGTNSFDWALSDLGASVFRPCCDADGEEWLQVRNADASNYAFSLSDQPISAIPLPAGMWLFLSALSGLGVVGWRKAHSNTSLGKRSVQGAS